MKNDFHILRENDLPQCIRVFVNLSIIFLVIIFIASSVSASDENNIWKKYGSKTLYKGDTYIVQNYKIEAYDFPIPDNDGYITNPSILLKIYKDNNPYPIQEIHLTPHESESCDEIKITAVDLPSGQVVEWQSDEYQPWGKIEVAIKRRPKFDIDISTDKQEYQQNSIIKVNIIVRNEGNSDAKNVELEYDTGGLEVDSTNIDKSYTRFTRGDSLTGELNLKAPKAVVKKETYPISVTVTGEDLEGDELSETISVSIDVLSDSGSINVYSTPSGAKISIDGTYKGITPLTIPDVSAGYHTIKLTNSGYQDYFTERIYISAGETKTISATLTPKVVPTAQQTATVPKTGYILIYSDPPNANIELDGDYRGTTPLSMPLSVGYHTIKITKSGYKDSIIKNIYVSADKTMQVSESLTPIEPPPSKSALIVFLILIGIAFFALYSHISKKRLPTPQSVRPTPVKPAPVKPKPVSFTPTKPTPINPNEYILDNGEVIYLSEKTINSSGKVSFVYKTSRVGYLAKIYKEPKDWQKEAVRQIVSKYNIVAKNPNLRNLFCWPEAVIVEPKLGVLMPEAPSNLRDMKFLLLPKAFNTLPSDGRGDWKMRVKIAIKMAHSMSYMNKSGLCHADISFNNILVDPQTGEMVWIDLDGLVIPGDRYLRPTVGGTLRYMAPELVTGKAEPSIRTDLHSLAVLIYELLLMNHPLMRPGNKQRKDVPINPNKDDQEELECGEYALYVEDPSNTNNRPIGDYIGSPVLGKEIQELMRMTFVDGIQNPQKRPPTSAWERTLKNLLNDLKRCKNSDCRFKYFPKTPNKKCPWCKR